MDGNYLPMEVHKEFARRQDEENSRQNVRIGELETKIEEIHSLALSMERMSANVEKMAEAIERQGNLIEKQTTRIDKMEQKPAGRWEGIKSKAMDTAVTVIITALVIGAVMLAAQYIK